MTLWRFAQDDGVTNYPRYTQYADNGTPWKFWYRPTFDTQTDIQTNGHTTMSHNFEIVPLCISMSRCHHTVCIGITLFKVRGRKSVIKNPKKSRTSDLDAPKLQGLGRNAETGTLLHYSSQQTARDLFSCMSSMHPALLWLPAVREGINFHTWRNKQTHECECWVSLEELLTGLVIQCGFEHFVLRKSKSTQSIKIHKIHQILKENVDV